MTKEEKEYLLGLVKSNSKEKLIDFFGDSAGSVPIGGGVITAIKNQILSVSKEAQLRKLVEFVIMLSERVENLENKIALINDDNFNVQFLNMAIKVSFSTSKEEVLAYINYIKNYLEKQKIDDELFHIYHVITSINPSSYKELEFLSKYEIRNDYISAREIYLNEKDGNKLESIGILDTDLDFVRFNNIKELLNYGLLHEKRASFHDENPVSFIHKIKLSTLGEKILEYIK